MKYILLLLVFLASFPFAIAECVEGIDDVCDPNCVVVDYDCVQNDFAGTQDLSCFADGVCEEFCQLDPDCRVLENEEVQDESLLFIDSEPTNYQAVLILVGLALLGVVVFIGFLRFTHHYQKKKYKDTLPYGYRALQQGYSKEDIKQSLEHRGYSQQYIKGFFKALDRKP